LSGGGDNDLFNINATTGEVTFKTAPDYEAPAEEEHTNAFQLLAHAVGRHGVHDVTQAVTVTVSDVNDNAPIFSSGTTGSEAENTVAIIFVYDTTATDTYALSLHDALPISLSGGGDNDLFNINATTGEVTFKTAPDYEAP